MAAELIAEGAGVLIGGIQALIESGKAKRANADLQKLFKQRKAYSTPKEVFDILNLTEFNAQQGFSDQTTEYLTGQAESGLAAGLGTAKLLGADPNQLGGILNQYYGDIFKIGAESDLVKMKKFDSFTNALQLVAQNKDAEFQSADNLIKDQMQAAAARLGSAERGISSGLNFAIQSGVNLASSGLYDTNSTNPKTTYKSNREELLATNTPTTAPRPVRIG